MEENGAQEGSVIVLIEIGAMCHSSDYRDWL